MDSDNQPHPIVLKYAFDRGTRGDALRNPETRAAIDRLIALGATSPDSARALQGLNPQEKSALAWLRSKRLAREIAPDLWCLNPLVWDSGHYLEPRQQAWIAIIIAAGAVVALWLKYFS